MKLIDLLVQELPKRGGWPEGAIIAVDYLPVQMGTKLVLTDKGAFFRSKSNERVTREQYEAALQQSVWDGKGLPPVGTICEYQTSSNGNLPVRIECVTQDGVAFTWLGGPDPYKGLDCVSTFYAAKYFKPIRSEADRMRDEIAKDINAAVDASGTLGHVLYDAIAAGKIPHIRIE